MSDLMLKFIVVLILGACGVFCFAQGINIINKKSNAGLGVTWIIAAFIMCAATMFTAINFSKDVSNDTKTITLYNCELVQDYNVNRHPGDRVFEYDLVGVDIDGKSYRFEISSAEQKRLDGCTDVVVEYYVGSQTIVSVRPLNDNPTFPQFTAPTWPLTDSTTNSLNPKQ